MPRDAQQTDQPLVTIGISPDGMTVYVNGKPGVHVPVDQFPLWIERLAREMRAC